MSWRISYSEGQALIKRLFSQESPLRGKWPEWANEERLEKQRQYALLTWRALEYPFENERQTKVALLEGGAGVGKTLGYGVPVLLTSRRVAVSTHSRQLQEQVLTTLEIVESALRELGAPRRVIRLRVGMSTWISLRRLRVLLDQGDERDAGAARWREELQAVLAWAERTEEPTLLRCQNEFGDHAELLDLLARYAGVSYEEVQRVRQAMRRGQAIEPLDRAAQAYLEHVDAARQADVLILNHALMLVHASQWFRLLDPDASREFAARPIEALVVDEADHLPDAARSLEEDQVSLSRVRWALRTWCEAHPGEKKLARAGEATAAAWEALVALHGQLLTERLLRRSRVTGDRVAAGRALTRGTWVAAVTAWHDALRAVAGLADRWIGRGEPEDDVPPLVVLHAIETLERWLTRAGLRAAKRGGTWGARHGIPEIEWSPKLRYPTLACAPESPRQLISRYWRVLPGQGAGPRVRRIVCTSATLSVKPAGTPDALAFAAYERECGLTSEHVRIVERCRIELRKYGSVEFRLASAAAPEPVTMTSEDDEVDEAGQAYVDWVAEVIARAYEAATQPDACNAGRKVLALCTSWRQVDWVAAALQRAGRVPGEACQVHRQGALLSRLVAAWRNETKPAVLLTPSAWEGLDCPGTISDLVIGWVPYSPPRGGVAEDDADNRWDYQRSKADAIRRLKQGFGRPIRRMRDRARIWIADPRFPAPPTVRPSREGVRMDGTLLAAIPPRYRDAWNQAAPI